MDVVIIGAGLSGLTAASVLTEAGLRPLILEAGPEVGGRIQSLRDAETHRSLADLGPTWVWPKYQPVVARWIEALGIETFPQYNEGDAVLLGYGPTPYRQPLPGQDGMVRLKGGPSAFVESARARCAGASFLTATAAKAIRDTGDGSLEITTASGGTIAADRVILSTPLRVAATHLDMPWASPALLDAMRQMPTWMSTHAKAVALYDRPFWRVAGLSGRIASRTGPLAEAHDHSGPEGAPAAIFGFVGWSPDDRRMSADGLRQAILDQLIESFGSEAASPLDLRIQDWATNPYIATELDLSQPPLHPDIGPGILREPQLGGRVHLAISEAADVSPGLIEGALASGEQAAIALLNSL